ncbi:MAG: DHH family phosphoesterase [Lachnospiraceae bacterium]|nr:DHH family phosphoesterase [Lachnospiraceae bacterium]
MNTKLKFKGKLITHLIFPVFIGIALLMAGIGIYFMENTMGIAIIASSLLLILVCIIMFFVNKPLIMRDLIGFATDYAQIQKELLHDLAIPYGLCDPEGCILWSNRGLKEIIEEDLLKNKKITDIFKEVNMENIFVEDEHVKIFDILYENSAYRMECRKINVQNAFNTTKVLDIDKKDEFLIVFYLFDITEIKQLKKDNEDQKMVAGLIYIDNYEEAMDSVEDVKRSLLSALIERKINQFASNIDGIVRKLEKDKYFIAFMYKYLDGLKSTKFTIIDEVKNVNIGNEMDVTISIGLGVHGETYVQNCEYSRIAMDLALGRGGDQAVIKDCDKIYYYGGKSKQVEKTTRVKARVKAHALRELLSTKEKVIIMGHQIGDIDSFGSALGLYRAMKHMGKKVHIVINEITTSLRPVVERVVGSGEYEDDLILTSADVLDIIDSNTTVVVVDVNRASRTECPELLIECKSVVVLDHHRQTTDGIENALLSYVEPYASSTCEMVAEILQYIHDGIKLKQIEADAMYGGIMIDTNNFSQKTGVRTFEAAAYLRRCGADVTRVRMMFRNNIEEFKTRAMAISRAEVFCEQYIISDCPSDGVESPTIVCAQAANELLNISGIAASFVLTKYNDKIYVSARSISNINVQLIMERIGGGGHMNIAGAQLEGYEIDEAKNLVIDVVKNMITEGDL